MATQQEWEATLARKLIERGLLDSGVMQQSIAEVEARRSQGAFTNLTTYLVLRRLVQPQVLQRTIDAVHLEIQQSAPGLHRRPAPPVDSEDVLLGETLHDPEVIETPSARFKLPPAPKELAAGDTVAGCKIERELGKGGMGTVYLARDGERQVAIKLIRDIDKSPRRRERFRREVKAAQTLNHPGIVKLFRADADGDLPVMVMEFIPGSGLDEVLAGDDYSLDGKLELLEQVCVALGYAHSRSIVHRDLKPENILVTPDGKAKVTDFGVARDISRNTSLTVTGEMVGTPHYMSPEVLHGGKATVRSDVFSLGVLYYQALLGRRPFEANTPVTLCALIASETPIMPSKAAGLHRDYDQVVRKALAKRPEDRYETAMELAREIRRLRLGRPLKSAPQTAGVGGRRALRLLLGFTILCALALGLLVALDPYGPGPKVTPSATTPTAEVPLQLAEVRRHLARGNLRRADEILVEASLDQRDAIARAIDLERTAQQDEVDMARSFLREFQSREALKRLKLASMNRPDAAQLHLELARVLVQHGRLQEARAERLAAERADPELVAAATALAANLTANEGVEPSGRQVGAKWNPCLGAVWSEREGFFEGRGRGIGPRDLSVLVRRQTEWGQRYVVSVQLELTAGDPEASAGLLIGATGTDDPVVVCAESTRRVRVARLEEGRWVDVQIVPASFPATGWVQLRVEVAGSTLRVKIADETLPDIALDRPVTGYVGLVKLHDTEVRFRDWRYALGN